MLVVVFRLVQGGLEVEVGRDRAFPCPSERIHAQAEVGLDVEVICFFAQEGVFSLGIPVDVVLQLALHACVQVCGVPPCAVVLPGERRVEGVVFSASPRPCR